MPECKIEGCTNPARVRGVCEKHWKRFQKYGNYEGGDRNHGTPEERFWRFVEKGRPTECWPWRGTLGREGYGQLKVANRPIRYVRAHRLSYMMHKGPLTAEEVVRHTCDNRCCVNPAHLLAGSHADNVADMVERGRQSSAPNNGILNPRAILNEVLVREIRASPLSHGKLATEIGVSRSTIAAVRARRIWPHVA